MKTESSPTSKDISLSCLQAMNKCMYEVTNDRNYDTRRMVSRLHRYTASVLRFARKKELEPVGWWLAMSFSWSLALANRLHINLEEELWKRFPHRCPSCDGLVCSCNGSMVVEEDPEVFRPKPMRLSQFQGMLAGIYPGNNLDNSLLHLAEEVGEVDEAVEHYLGTHDPWLFGEIGIKLADTVAHMLAVATCLNLSLADEVAKLFAEGCPKCHKDVCRCGFTVDRFPISSPIS